MLSHFNKQFANRRKMFVATLLIFSLYFLNLTPVYINSDKNGPVGFISFPASQMHKNNRSEPPLNMSIFYESLCPDSVDFFKKQFAPNWRSFYTYLNVTFVPYGNANTSMTKKGKYNFKCQHGPDECENNRIQACAISKYKHRRMKLFSFISCYMSSRKQKQDGPKCANKYKIKYRALQSCSARKEGDDLLAYYGNLTHNFRPKITWIPTIVFNNKYNQTDNEKAASNLKSLLCTKLENKPKVCKNKKRSSFFPLSFD